jgi:hypothetical protein
MFKIYINHTFISLKTSLFVDVPAFHIFLSLPPRHSPRDTDMDIDTDAETDMVMDMDMINGSTDNRLFKGQLKLWPALYITRYLGGY